MSSKVAERDGLEIYLLHEFGADTERLTLEKLQKIWNEVKQHDVLFSDYTQGDFSAFRAVFFDLRSVWFEILRGEDVVGVVYVNRVIPNIDLSGHIAFFDRKASGREELLQDLARWLFDRYNVRRISGEIPVYQSGAIRFLKKVGFKEEGRREDAVLYKGRWFPNVMFGLLERYLNGTDAIRRGEKRDADRDSGGGH